MKFGIFYEITVPRKWGREAEAKIFHEVVEQVVLAEQVGFDNFWTVEHHFLDEFSHCSAPEVLYGVIAAKTKRIRIGHGVRLLPFPYNHPVRVAESAATLDILSNGRLEFGTGRSATMTELGGFGINPADTRGMWEESLSILPRMWKEDPFRGHEGKYFKIPQRNVVPKPIQTPHPPLWMACSSPESHELAGKKGLGLLSFTLALHLQEVGRRVQLYKNAVANAKPVGDFANNQAAVFSLVHCSHTNKEAREEAEEGVLWYNNKSFEQLGQSVDAFVQKGSGYEYYDKFNKAKPEKFNFDYVDKHSMVIVGDPAYCIEKVQQYKDIGVEQLLCLMQNYGIPHEKTMQSIRLWGEKVIPYFK